MTTIRKNEAKTDIVLFNFIKENRVYSKSWSVKKQDNKYIQEVLDKTSKKSTGWHGYPDLIYVNENKKLLILIENKDHTKNHISKNEDKPADYAVDGVKHYLSFFTEEKLKQYKDTIRAYLKDWKIIGIASSGDINAEYNHRLDTFIIENDLIININEKGILDEEDYLAFFENIDLEKISSDISRSSIEINRLLRNLDSQKRPILLSALMICLYPNKDVTDFQNSYSSWSTQTIIRNIPTTVEDILIKEGIDKNKIDVLTNEIAFVKTDNDLISTDILKDILKELQEKVIPLFQKKTSYDIIGKFYEEFLRYAGISNVKKGIVLTPNHITTLFTDLIDIRTNDIIFDPACGTGAFLIAGMNKLVNKIENSDLPNKKSRIQSIKEKQLIGFEKSSTMYSLAISNMLFRGDGKSQIFNEDFFSDKAALILDGLKQKPTIGFINPPYGGKDNKANPTKKEIQFLERLLDNCSRYGVIIAPLSTYFQDDSTRERILSKHSLKYVVNMPSELFQPNASTHTAIAVFETNKPHNDSEVVFYDLQNDGFVLSKNKGRTDVLNKWNAIKKEILKKIKNPAQNEDSISLIYKTITSNDEWIIQAHAKTNYEGLNRKTFEKSIKEYVVFSTKLKLDLIDKDIDEITLLEIFNENNISARSVLNEDIGESIDKSNWKEFKFDKEFSISRGKRLVKLDQINGDIAYISSSKKNNGVDNYILPPDYMTVYQNALTLSNSGSVGYCFYHQYNFVSSDHCTVVKLKKKDVQLNTYIALFLKPIIEAMRSKYNFAREINNERLEKEIVILPTNKDGSPDWQFMENYIKSLPYSSNL